MDVPPGVWITVGNVSREWKQGAIMSFDDSYHHSVDASQAVSGLASERTLRLHLPRVIVALDSDHEPHPHS